MSVLETNESHLSLKPAVEKLAYSRQETADAIGVCLRTLDDMLAEAETTGFPVVRVGRRVLIPVKQLDAWLLEQAGCTEGRNQKKDPRAGDSDNAGEY